MKFNAGDKSSETVVGFTFDGFFKVMSLKKYDQKGRVKSTS